MAKATKIVETVTTGVTLALTEDEAHIMWALIANTVGTTGDAVYRAFCDVFGEDESDRYRTEVTSGQSVRIVQR